MKYFLIACPILLMTVSLSACRTSPSKSSLEFYEAGQTNPSSDNGLVNGQRTSPRLSARALARDECGLFVWSADDDRRFILFSQVQEQAAIWASPNGEVPLKITQISGQEFQQQFTQQSFVENLPDGKAALNGSNLKLSLRNVEELIDSTRFKAGTLTQVVEDGSQRIIPVVGLSTCRS